MRKIELKLDKSRLKDAMNGIFAISVVKSPAIQASFIMLSEEKKPVKLFFNDEQMIITGPVMIPDKMIYRSDVAGAEAEVFFSKETVRELAYHFLSEMRNNQTTLEHQEESKDLTLLESWIVEDASFDKIVKLGIDVPSGTWMASYKVNNSDLWEDIKSGKYTGFSVEAAMLAEVVEEYSNQSKRPSNEEIRANILKIIADNL